MTGRQQFTDEQFRYLTDNFDIVLLEKFHGGWDITLHHQAAHRLIELRPGLEVYPYFSTKYWFDHNRWDGAPIDPDWLLRDNQGNLVHRYEWRDGRRRRIATYVDLANPSYRAWALGVMASWLEAAPYAGISFDAAEPIGDYGTEKELKRWEELLGSERVATYNDGMRELLASAKERIGQHRQVVFNPIAPNPLTGPARNLDLLQVTDGALDERFCLDVRGQVHALEDDLSLLTSGLEARLFMRTNYLESFNQDERDRYQRFCLGVFLLGWQPGRSFFQFGGSYTADQLQEQSPDLDVNLGHPAAPYSRNGTLASREFHNGVLYVNLGADPVDVDIREPLTELRGGRILDPYQPGRLVSVPPQDALFFLRSAFLEQGAT